MIIKPKIRQTDPQWYRRLQETILGIIDELRQVKVKGDGITTRVTRNGDGSTVHAVTHPPVYAKITADNGDGTYHAVEQIWDASANDWTDKTNGRTFDSNSDTEPPIQEEDNVQGLPDGGELVVLVRKHVDDEGNKQWIFRTRLQGTWEATTDASSGKITLKRLNSDGSLAGTGQSFDVIPSS